MDIKNLPAMLTVNELADFLRVQARTVRRRIDREDIVAYKPPGSKQWRIPRDEALRQLGILHGDQTSSVSPRQ